MACSRAMPSTIGEYPAQSAPPLSESGHRAIPAATYAHALPGTPLGRDDLAEGRLVFQRALRARPPADCWLRHRQAGDGPAEVRAGVRQLVTQRGDSRGPIERKPAVVSSHLGVSTRGLTRGFVPSWTRYLKRFLRRSRARTLRRCRFSILCPLRDVSAATCIRRGTPGSVRLLADGLQITACNETWEPRPGARSAGEAGC